MRNKPELSEQDWDDIADALCHTMREQDWDDIADALCHTMRVNWDRMRSTGHDTSNENYRDAAAKYDRAEGLLNRMGGIHPRLP